MEKALGSEDMQTYQNYEGSELCIAKDAKVGYRIPTSYSQEEIDALTYKYLSKGWRPVASATTLGFISPDGSWFTGFDAPSRVMCDFPIEKARRLGFCAKQEEILSEEVQMPETVVRLPSGEA